MKILVVDDDPAGLEIRRLLLEKHGFTVVTAADAESARGLFASDRPDAAVLDLRIPSMEDGLALIRDFRAVRVVVLCGRRADLDGREEASMAAAILGKPARSVELVRAIRG